MDTMILNDFKCFLIISRLKINGCLINIGFVIDINPNIVHQIKAICKQSVNSKMIT